MKPKSVTLVTHWLRRLIFAGVVLLTARTAEAELDIGKEPLFSADKKDIAAQARSIRGTSGYADHLIFPEHGLPGAKLAPNKSHEPVETAHAFLTTYKTVFGVSDELVSFDEGTPALPHAAKGERSYVRLGQPQSGFPIYAACAGKTVGVGFRASIQESLAREWLRHLFIVSMTLCLLARAFFAQHRDTALPGGFQKQFVLRRNRQSRPHCEIQV